MGTVKVLDFEPDGHSGDWKADEKTEYQEEVDLSVALAAIARGMPTEQDWNLELALLEVGLVAQMVVCTRGRPLVLKPTFAAANRRLRSLVSEAIGLAAAVRLAETRHAWPRRYGWLPKDCDAWPLPWPSKGGVRPDLLFPTPGGAVFAEARGRSQGRRTPKAHSNQNKRMRELKSVTEEQRAKVFMGWAWAGGRQTRVDHFVLKEPPTRIDSGALAQELTSQAATLWRSVARGASTLALPGLGDPIRGEWLKPYGIGVDVFVGVLPPDLVATDLEELVRARHQMGTTSLEDALDQPAAPTSAGTTRAVIDAVAQSILRQNGEVIEQPAIVGPIVAALRRRRES